MSVFLRIVLEEHLVNRIVAATRKPSTNTSNLYDKYGLDRTRLMEILISDRVAKSPFDHFMATECLLARMRRETAAMEALVASADADGDLAMADRGQDAARRRRPALPRSSLLRLDATALLDVEDSDETDSADADDWWDDDDDDDYSSDSDAAYDDDTDSLSTTSGTDTHDTPPPSPLRFETPDGYTPAQPLQTTACQVSACEWSGEPVRTRDLDPGIQQEKQQNQPPLGADDELPVWKQLAAAVAADEAAQSLSSSSSSSSRGGSCADGPGLGISLDAGPEGGEG